MRKFVLYFLLILFLAAVGTFSYGFYNGKQIRDFAGELGGIRARHNFSGEISEIENSFRESGKKDVIQIRDDSKQLAQKLDEIAREADAAEKGVNELKVPETARGAKELAAEYFAKTKKQAGDLKEVINYMGQIIEVAAVFDEIGESTSLDEMKNLIGRAKDKAGTLKTDTLPADLISSAQNLKEAMNNFLAKMEEVAMLKSENTSELDASYGEFSQKEDEFFANAKKYIDGMEDLNIIEGKINADIKRLGRVKFSLR